MKNNKTFQFILVGVALFVLPLILQGFGNAWVRIADMALLYILLALGLNIVVGYAGLLVDRGCLPCGHAHADLADCAGGRGAGWPVWHAVGCAHAQVAW